MENYLETIEQLNNILFDKYGETGYRFTFTSNGDGEDFIQFGDKLIWHREYDERIWLKGFSTFNETLLNYCIKNFNDYITELSKLKL